MHSYNLVADIGGTNARFALVQEQHIKDSIYLTVADFANIEHAITHALQAFSQANIQQVGLALAGPVHRDKFTLTNNHWQVDKQVVGAVCAKPVFWFNDFAAQAWGIASLNEADLLTVKTGDPVAKGNRLVLGPGTGLGVAGLIWSHGAWQPVIGEGGHVGFAPLNDIGIEILRVLRKQYQHVTAEHLLSGSGLPNLYQALAQIRGKQGLLSTAKDITQAAFSQPSAPNALAQETMQLFFQQLGHATANAALQMGATGGAFLTGGLLPKFQKQLVDSGFVEGFCSNQNQHGYVTDIPVYLNIDENLGLKGAALALMGQG